jgi:hypothetical protein
MITRTCASLVLCLGVAGVAGGQVPPKALLAGKQADFSQARSLPYQLSNRTIFENVIVDSQHLAMVVDWKKGKLEPVDLYSLKTVQIPTWNGIWNGIVPVATDPPDDAEPAGASGLPLPGTDWSALYVAHDGADMYFRLDLDAYPAARCTFTVNFQQYQNQVVTPGDYQVETILTDTGWSTMVWALSGPEYGNVYQSAYAAEAGYKYIQWKVPIEKLLYQPNIPSPLSPPSTPGRQGISNRFLTVLVYGEPDSGAPGRRDGGPSPRNSPMIINFPVPQPAP